jgi:hypothetical protein
MKKGEMSFQLVLIILASVLLVGATIAFVPKTIDAVQDFFNNKLIDFGLKTEEIPTVVIDEERIEEGTQIVVKDLTGEEDMYTIIKQAYGNGWDLEYKREICTIPQEVSEKLPENFNTLSLDEKKTILQALVFDRQIDDTDYIIIVWLCKGNIAPEQIEDKTLLEILSSDSFIGIIDINGRQYAHTINTEDTSPETPDLLWVRVSKIEDDGTITGTEVTAEEVQNLILAELYEEKT